MRLSAARKVLGWFGTLGLGSSDEDNTFPVKSHKFTIIKYENIRSFHWLSLPPRFEYTASTQQPHGSKQVINTQRGQCLLFSVVFTPYPPQPPRQCLGPACHLSILN